MEKQIDLVVATDMAAVTAMSEGAFRMGARAMQKTIEGRLSRQWPGPAVGIVADVPLPTYTPPADKATEVMSWWSGSDDEFFTNGPFVDRDEAVEALDGEGGHVVEAQRLPVTFSANLLIENQYFDNEDYFSGEHGEADRVGGADVIAAADAELQALLDAWLARWRHTFNQPEIFWRSGPTEYIPVDYTDDGPLDEDEERELAGLETIADGVVAYYQRERRHYLRERKAFFAAKGSGE